MAFIAKATLIGLKTAGLSVSASIWLPMIQQFPEYTFLALVSGAAGGLCRAITPWDGIGNAISAILVGTMVAVFAWPTGNAMVGSIFDNGELDPDVTVMMGAFITGVLGSAIVGAILDIFNARKKRMENEP